MSTKVKVILVDNDPDALTTFAETLQKAGYEVVTAGSETEAYTADLRGVSVVVSDLQLRRDSDAKDQTGLILLGQFASIPVKILWTNRPTDEVAARAQKLGAAVVNKQDGSAALLEKLQQLLDMYGGQ